MRGEKSLISWGCAKIFLRSHGDIKENTYWRVSHSALCTHFQLISSAPLSPQSLPPLLPHSLPRLLFQLARPFYKAAARSHPDWTRNCSKRCTLVRHALLSLLSCKLVDFAHQSDNLKFKMLKRKPSNVSDKEKSQKPKVRKFNFYCQ